MKTIIKAQQNGELNLFEQATEKPKKQATSKPEIKVSGLTEQIHRFKILRDKAEEIKGEMKLLEDEIKTAGKEQFLSLYKASYPGSFRLESEGESVMIVPMDKYLKLDGDRAKELNEKFGNVAEKEVTFTFNPEVLQQYNKEISAAILSADMPDEAKQKLILSETEYKIKKGLIKELLRFGGKMRDVFFAISPIFAIKK